MLIVASGNAGSDLVTLGEAMPQPQLWIAHDIEPRNGAAALVRPPWSALIALSERMAHPSPDARLEISPLDGFNAPLTRQVTVLDHTEQTRRLSAKIVIGRFSYASIVVATASGLYDDGCARMLATSAGTDRALDAARQIAGSAIAHFAWNCSRLAIPVLLLAWATEKTLKGKVVGETPHLPRRLLATADLTLERTQDRTWRITNAPESEYIAFIRTLRDDIALEEPS